MNVTKAKFLLFLDLDSKMAFDFIVCFPRCDYWSIIDICLHNRIHNIFINLFVMSRGNHMLKCLNRMKHYCKKHVRSALEYQVKHMTVYKKWIITIHLKVTTH